MEPADLDDGKYFIRLFPKNPQSNPSGRRTVGTHFLEGSINNVKPNGDVRKKAVSCLAKDTSEKDGVCYFCDVNQVLEEIKFFDDPKVDDAVRKCATNLDPTLEYWYVISLMADSYTKPAPWDDTKTVTRYKPAPFGAEKEHGKILKVKYASFNDLIMEVLVQAKERGDDITDADEGSYLVLTKEEGKYELTLSKHRDCEIQNEGLLSKYPQNFSKMSKKNAMTPVKAAAFMNDKESCWWGPYVVKYCKKHGHDLTPDGDEEEEIELPGEEEDE